MDAVTPLAGLRVLEMGRAVAAPYAAQLLAEWGADVIKLERPGEGDYVRHLGPPFVKAADGPVTDESSLFASFNRGKRSVTLDHTTPAGGEALRELVRHSQVLVENYRVGSLARHGLDHAGLRDLNPALVHCSITGYGQDGPAAGRAGVDTVVQALSGLMSVTGPADGQPQRVGVYIIDLMAGQHAAAAVLAALLSAQRTGEGCHLDVSLLDVGMAAVGHRAQEFLLGGPPPARMGAESTAVPVGGPLECSDGTLMVQASTDDKFDRLCRAIGREDLATDPRFAKRAPRVEHKAELLPELDAWMRHRSRDAWQDVLESAGVLCAPILDIPEALEQPQVRHRQVVRTYDHPRGGEIPAVRSPVLFSGKIAEVQRPPRLGEHNEEVLGGLIGLSPEQIASASGVRP